MISKIIFTKYSFEKYNKVVHLGYMFTAYLRGYKKLADITLLIFFLYAWLPWSAIGYCFYQRQAMIARYVQPTS